MKLQSPSWKSIWFDNHLSERFLKEWNRLEQGPLQNIDSTSAWMDQIVIELGQLAQSMIHLEESETHTSHLRLALDRSLKLAVMAARLSGSLEEAYRGTSVEAADFLMGESGGKNSASGNPPVQNAAALGGPGTTAESVPPAHLAADTTPAPQAPPAQIAAAAVPNPVTQLPLVSGQIGSQQAVQTAMPASLPQSVPTQISPPMAQDPRFAYRAPDQRKISPEQERLVLPTSRGKLEKQNAAPERPMNETILSLSDRGLSIDEIEIVTGQSRETIEKVLSAI